MLTRPLPATQQCNKILATALRKIPLLTPTTGPGLGKSFLYPSRLPASSVLLRPPTKPSNSGLRGQSTRRFLPLRSVRSASSRRWVARQSRDSFARQARVQGLKSRAAFKLLQINDKHQLFRPGQTVVDLGYAPGSWSQVAIDMIKPSGRVIGVDVIPAQPPKGVSTIQGNFLSPNVQASIKSFLHSPARGRTLPSHRYNDPGSGNSNEVAVDAEMTQGYVDLERHASLSETAVGEALDADTTVDVVLSDMCEPWEQTEGFFKRTLSDPYLRMMNTSGNNFKDHAGSMDLCRSALLFSFDVLKIGGHFVCKFYQGAEDKGLEKSLKVMFHQVYREKPQSSRNESKEAYFVAMKRLAKVEKPVFSDGI